MVSSEFVKTKNILHTQVFASYKIPIYGIKRDKNLVDDLSKYQWDKENCINDLQQADDFSKLNYNGLVERYSLQRDNDKCQFIWNDVRSFEMLTLTYN